MGNINAFYTLQQSYIDALVGEAAKQHDSMEQYIRRRFGIEDGLIEELRIELLGWRTLHGLT